MSHETESPQSATTSDFSEINVAPQIQQPATTAIVDTKDINALADDYVEKNRVITVRHDFYVYYDTEGIWKCKSKDLMATYIREHYEYVKDKNAIFIESLVREIKLRTNQDSFPSYEGEGNILVFQNKAFNPVTNKPLAFSPEHYALGRVDFEYDAEAKCSRWEDFLKEIWEGCSDIEDRKTLLQQFMFLSMTNITKFEKMLLLYGAGSNGKSVILNVLRLIVGEHNVSQVRLSELNSKFSNARLENKLVNIESDVDNSLALKEGFFKSVVSGEHLEVEKKHRDSYLFKPMTTMWVATNILPKVTNNSHGFYRRICILEFERIFEDDKQDKNLLGILKKELSGITAWVLSCGETLLEAGQLTIPVSTKQLLDEYQLDNNPVAQFLGLQDEEQEYKNLAQLHSQPAVPVKRSLLYEDYCAFCKANNYAILNSARFGRELKFLNIDSKKTSEGRFYIKRG